jgi:hypothetical protein
MSKEIVIIPEFTRALRKVISSNEAHVIEVEMKEGYRFILQYLLDLTEETIINNKDWSEQKIREIQPFMEKIFINYCFNSLFVGWGNGYSEYYHKDHVYIDGIGWSLTILVNDMKNEAKQLDPERKLTVY